MKDSDITLKMIEPLIVNVEAEGNRVFAEFALPGSDEVVEAEAPMRKVRSTKNEVKRALGRTAKMQARVVAARALRSALGGGIAGRVARQGFNAASRGAMRNMGGGNSFGQDEIDAATVVAFIKVKDHFHYDEATGTWVKPPLPPPPKELSPFEKQLKEHPIANTYDRLIFARLLAELANADGHLAQEEVEFFTALIPDEVGRIEDLVKGDPVSRIECQEVTHGVQETIYMCAWTISLIDFDLDPMEQELLTEYGEMFGFAQTQIDEVAKKAKYRVLEGAINPETPRNELFELADKINLNRDDAERCKIGVIKRLG